MEPTHASFSMQQASAVAARLQIGGERQSGQDVRTQNVMAATAMANIVKSSLGPVGLDKARRTTQAAAGLWRTACGAMKCGAIMGNPYATPPARLADAGGRHWRRYNYQ
jgi:hypothetical protein